MLLFKKHGEIPCRKKAPSIEQEGWWTTSTRSSPQTLTMRIIPLGPFLLLTLAFPLLLLLILCSKRLLSLFSFPLLFFFCCLFCCLCKLNKNLKKKKKRSI